MVSAEPAQNAVNYCVLNVGKFAVSTSVEISRNAKHGPETNSKISEKQWEVEAASSETGQSEEDS